MSRGHKLRFQDFICEDFVLYVHQNYLLPPSDRLSDSTEMLVFVPSVSWIKSCLCCITFRWSTLWSSVKSHTEILKEVRFRLNKAQFLDVYARYVCYYLTNVGRDIDLSEHVILQRGFRVDFNWPTLYCLGGTPSDLILWYVTQTLTDCQVKGNYNLICSRHRGSSTNYTPPPNITEAEAERDVANKPTGQKKKKGLPWRSCDCRYGNKS